jgi:hypothetical protein
MLERAVKTRARRVNWSRESRRWEKPWNMAGTG